MTERVRIEAGTGGRLRVLKVARPGEHRRLAHELVMLRAARHPGVVEVVAWHDDDIRPELELAFVGSHSLETAPTLPLPALARVAAALFATLADLHALGVVHGGLDESHVVLDGDGRPVLCSFSRAEPLRGDRPDDHGGSTGDGDDEDTPAGDVAAAGALLTRLLATETESDPIPANRLPLARPRTTNTWHRRLLLSIADQATHPDPTRRPSARQLSVAFAEAVEGRHSPPLRRWAPAALVGTGVVLVILLVNWLQPGAGADPELSPPLDDPVDEVVIGHDPRSDASRPSSTSTPTTVIRPEPSAAPVLEHDGRRYSVGRAGDLAVVGDWDCDGEDTPALVRPATGEVFVFDAWAAEAAVEIRARETIAGATRPRRSENGACDVLVVDRTVGEAVEIEMDGAS